MVKMLRKKRVGLKGHGNAVPVQIDQANTGIPGIVYFCSIHRDCREELASALRNGGKIVKSGNGVKYYADF